MGFDLSVTLLKPQEGIFFIIKKKKENGEYVPVYKSETRINRQGKATSFKRVIIDSFRFCHDDQSMPVEICIMKWFKSGKHKVISKGYVTYM